MGLLEVDVNKYVIEYFPENTETVNPVSAAINIALKKQAGLEVFTFIRLSGVVIDIVNPPADKPDTYYGCLPESVYKKMEKGNYKPFKFKLACDLID